MRHLLAAVWILVPVPLLAQGIMYSDAPTQSCLETLDSAEGMAECAGRSADMCIQANAAGGTTGGMGGCLDGELTFWDNRLIAEYRTALASAKAADAEAKNYGSSVHEMAPALVAMQRAWIPFRDAACDYARSQWGGGTGGGPATLQCLMTLTAGQTDRLARRLGD